MSQPIPDAFRIVVWQRARSGCEYCRVPAFTTWFPHEVDHVIAEQHGGETSLDNLALACFQCNRIKGPNIASVDPETKRIVPLFNPRSELWSDHFENDGGRIIPKTAIGRATARLLEFEETERREARQHLWRLGRYPV